MRYNVRIEDNMVESAENHSALTFAEAIDLAMNGMAAGDVVTISPMRESECVHGLRSKLDEIEVVLETR